MLELPVFSSVGKDPLLLFGAAGPLPHRSGGLGRLILVASWAVRAKTARPAALYLVCLLTFSVSTHISCVWASQAGPAEGPGAGETKAFDGLSHEGVESFWQQLQIQASQWMMQEQQQITWAVEAGSDPYQPLSPSDPSEVPEAFDKETPGASRAAEALGIPARKRVRLDVSMKRR